MQTTDTMLIMLMNGTLDLSTFTDSELRETLETLRDMHAILEDNPFRFPAEFIKHEMRRLDTAFENVWTEGETRFGWSYEPAETLDWSQYDEVL